MKMKIAILIEDYVKGGQNAFVSELINSWPEPDEFIIISNELNIGLDMIKYRCKKDFKIIKHKLDIDNIIALNLSARYKFLRKIFMAYGRYFLFIYQIYKMFRLINQVCPNHLIISNGGYPGGQTCRAAAVACLFSFRFKPVLISHNTSIPIKIWQWPFEKIIDVLVLKSVKYFVVVSKHTYESIAHRFFGLSRNKLLVIYNGINPHEKKFDNLMSFDKETSLENYKLLCIANFEKRKGHEFLIKSFVEISKFFPKSKLLFAGTGSEERLLELKKFSEEMKVQDNLVFLGYVDDVYSLINTIDILLIGSQEFESFGLIALEAMNKRKPVVTTDTGGLPEVVDDGVTGFVCSKFDTSFYSSKVLKLLNDKSLRINFGLAGYDRLINKFDSTRMARDYYSLLVK